MNFFGKLAIAGLAVVLSAGSQAAVLTYEYTAVVKRMTEYDHAKDSYANVNESAFVGTTIQFGDVIHGYIHYDSSSPRNEYQPGLEAGDNSVMYRSTSEELITYRFAGKDIHVVSSPDAYALKSVKDAPARPGAISSDYFAASSYSFDSNFLRSVHLFFWNADGTAFNDTLLPQQLDAALFDSLTLSGSFMQLASQDSLMFDADITAFRLIPADVPEPGVLLLLGIGAAGLLGSRRRMRA